MSRRERQLRQMARTDRAKVARLAYQNEVAFREQIHVHACEITDLHAHMLAYRDGLMRAVFLIAAARAGEWTPADDVSLQELKRLLERKPSK